MSPPRNTDSIPGPIPQKGLSKNSLSLPDIHQRPKLQSSPLRGIYGRLWTTENKRLMHEWSQRRWLENQGKHAMVDFSEKERKALKVYFDAIAEGDESRREPRRIRVDRLEDMLISLGLAGSRRQVAEIVRAVDDRGTQELDFDQYLTIMAKNPDPAIFQVTQAMIDRRLGDRNLNFRTAISAYRRAAIMDATGARGADPVKLGIPSPAPSSQEPSKKQETDEKRVRGTRILRNYAALQKNRFDRGEMRADRGEEGEDSMPFDAAGSVPAGRMQMLWQHVCRENQLVPSRPSSAERKTMISLGTPGSPRDIIKAIVPEPKKKVNAKPGGTLIIPAAKSEKYDVASRPTTREGHREFRPQTPLLV